MYVLYAFLNLFFSLSILELLKLNFNHLVIGWGESNEDILHIDTGVRPFFNPIKVSSEVTTVPHKPTLKSNLRAQKRIQPMTLGSKKGQILQQIECF